MTRILYFLFTLHIPEKFRSFPACLFLPRDFFLSRPAIVVLAALVLLCVNLYFQSDGVQQRIRDSRRTGARRAKSRSEQHVFALERFVIRGITVPDPTNANMNFAEAEACAFALRLATRGADALSSPNARCSSRKWSCASGKWRVGHSLGPPTRRSSRGARREAADSGKGVSFRTELQNVRLRGGTIVCHQFEKPRDRHPREDQHRANIAPDRSAVGHLEIGRSDFFGALKPRKIGGPFTWDGNNLDFPEIQGFLAGGKLTGKYLMQTREQPSFTLALQLSGVLLRKLAEEAQVEPGKTEGFLQGSLDIDW